MLVFGFMGRSLSWQRSVTTSIWHWSRNRSWNLIAIASKKQRELTGNRAILQTLKPSHVLPLSRPHLPKPP